MKSNPSHDFVWGTATAAYQVEGAWQTGGKGPSIWDVFSHTPGKIADGNTGDVACDQYHRFEEDVALMKELGVNAYRFSLSWSRILPDGRNGPNADGLAYYNRLIDCLLNHGIAPWVTLYHWDLPAALQFEYNGWLSRETVEAFDRYAGICFDAFGDRVKHWITFNEPWCSAVLGHGLGIFAPGRVSADEPYLAAHHLLLAHGRAVATYRSQKQDGVIGITNNCDWREPRSEDPADREAAQRALEFFYGWFTDPVVFGDYPDVMRERLGKRLPTFTDKEKQMLKNSSDFLGLNHYTTHYASAEPVQENAVAPGEGNGGLIEDQDVYLSRDSKWEQTDMGWFIVPWGFSSMLTWIGDRYPNIPVYVTENGCAVKETNLEEARQDDLRCHFITEYIRALQLSRENGVDVRGYFCWSFIDNFEWAAGFTKRFGLVHCDYSTLERTPKNSFSTYRNIIQQNSAGKRG